MNEQKKRGIIRRAFGGLWRFVGWLRVSLANVFFLALIIILIVALSKGNQLPTVPEQGVLVLNPSGFIVEQRSYSDPFSQLLTADEEDGETVLQDLQDAIEMAALDERITGMLISTDQLQGVGIAKVRELARSLDVFRESGKRIVAAGDSFGQNQYLLAAQADEIWMHPMGEVGLFGYGKFQNYFAEALDKLKVDFHIFRVGTFKSAVEFVERSDMSEADREASSVWLTQLWETYTGMVSQRRGIAQQSVREYVDKLPELAERADGDLATVALEQGLVDQLRDRTERRTASLELAGGEDNLIGFRRYLRAVRPAFELPEAGEPVIGVMRASGTIVDGEGNPGQIGGDSLARAIREAAEDTDLQAMVLRVDSPGGSAFASEVIREALIAFQASGKPLVVSMGSVAASGGYWISAGADRIFADATTLTGSIGVFGMLPTFPRGLAELGVYSDGVGTTALSGGFDPSRELQPALGRLIQQGVEYIYDRFVSLVSDGRELERSLVEERAEGRVWTGRMGVELGLVDELGGLSEAIDAAAELAGTEDYHVKELEQALPWQVQLLQQLSLTQQTWLRETVQAIIGAPLLSGIAPPAFLALLNTDPDARYVWCEECADL